MRKNQRNVQVYVTLNEPIYTEEEFNYIEYNLKKFCELGVDAVIVSDLGLVSYIKEKKYKINIHISTCASIYNAEGVQFCKKHGASRVILPRHMTIDEINGLIKKDSNIEYEVIVLNTNCQYDDGYCTYEHSLGNYIKDPSFEGGGCGAVEQMKVFLKKGHSSDLLLDIEGEYRRRQRTFNQSCGVCSIARLSKMGVDALKIVGREYVTEKKVKDVEFLYRVRKISETCNDESDLIKLVKSEYLKIYNKKCYDRCYY
ncbi:MAG: U32 family peptidase [Clostridia bacterium]|nr:U32 family peptidase [Clostridia bacterium]